MPLVRTDLPDTTTDEQRRAIPHGVNRGLVRGTAA
jgi:hypothetical protein